MNYTSAKNRAGLSTFALKIIAIVAMTIDHIGAVLDSTTYDGLLPHALYQTLRCIGRVAFPIFCYILVDGFFYTKNVQKYIIRLFLFSVISQIPYTLAIYKQFGELHHLNIFFTLTLGIIMLTGIDFSVKKLRTAPNQKQALLLPGIIVCCLVFYLCGNYGIDYGTYGILLILIFYFFREDETCYHDVKRHFLTLIIQFFCIFMLTLLLSDGTQIYCVFALIPIFFHSHQKGRGLKYFFYLYYPVHLLILYGIYLICMG